MLLSKSQHWDKYFSKFQLKGRQADILSKRRFNSTEQTSLCESITEIMFLTHPDILIEIAGRIMMTYLLAWVSVSWHFCLTRSCKFEQTLILISKREPVLTRRETGELNDLYRCYLRWVIHVTKTRDVRVQDDATKCDFQNVLIAANY